MRYPREHRDKKRREILQAAARLFRAHGFDGVGIDAIMEASNLTRGGFYGYFSSKAELFAECLGGDHDFIERLLARDGDTRDQLATQALEVVDGYLGPENREGVGRGCSIAALAVDTARHGPDAARGHYGEAIVDLAAQFERGLDDSEPRDPRALSSIALCVGSLLLARAVGDDNLGDAIQSAGRRGVRLLLDAPTDSA